MSFYFYIFFCLLAYRVHQAVHPFGSTTLYHIRHQNIYDIKFRDHGKLMDLYVTL